MTNVESGGIKKIIGNSVYEIVPTESGYAHMITISTCIVFVSLFGYTNSVGMMFNDFLSDIGAGVGGLTLIFGMNNACISISGIFANVAMKKMTLRQVGLIGSISYTAAWFLSGFAKNIYQLLFTFSLMGFGTGVLYSVMFTCLNSYYVSNKRIMIVSFCQAMVSVVYIFTPSLLKVLLNEYGYRGTVLLYSGILGHVIFASICIHPIEWHSPKKLLYKIVKGEDENDTTNSNQTELRFNFNNDEGKKRGKLSFITELLDLTLLKDAFFIIILMGSVVGSMTDITFFTVFPKYLYDFGCDTTQVASVLTVLGASDLGGRGFLVVFTKLVNVKSEPLFYLSMITATLFRIGFLFCNSMTSLYIITAILGFLRAPILTLFALVYADYMPEKFSAAFGWGIMFFGFMTLITMSFIGFLYEKTGNCTIGFIVLIASNLISLIPWTYKIWYFKRNVNNK